MFCYSHAILMVLCSLGALMYDFSRIDVASMLSRLPANGTAGEYAKILSDRLQERVTANDVLILADAGLLYPIGRDGAVILYRNRYGTAPRGAKGHRAAIVDQVAPHIRNMPPEGTALDYEIALRAVGVAVPSRKIARHAEEIGLVKIGKSGMVSVWRNTKHAPDTI